MEDGFVNISSQSKKSDVNFLDDKKLQRYNNDKVVNLQICHQFSVVYLMLMV